VSPKRADLRDGHAIDRLPVEPQLRILRFLPIVKLDPTRAVIGAYVLIGMLTTPVGAPFIVIAPDIAHNYRLLRDNSKIAVTYVAAVALWGVFALQDAVLTALQRAPWVPIENVTFGDLKMTAPPLLLMPGLGHTVFIAWVIPMAMLVIPVNYLIFGKVIPNWPDRRTESLLVERVGCGGLRRFLAHDYLAGELHAGDEHDAPGPDRGAARQQRERLLLHTVRDRGHVRLAVRGHGGIAYRRGHLGRSAVSGASAAHRVALPFRIDTWGYTAPSQREPRAAAFCSRYVQAGGRPSSGYSLALVAFARLSACSSLSVASKGVHRASSRSKQASLRW
jgi:hypothetical protein